MTTLWLHDPTPSLQYSRSIFCPQNPSQSKLKFGNLPRNNQKVFEGLFQPQTIHIHNLNSVILNGLCASVFLLHYWNNSSHRWENIILLHSSLEKGSFKFCLALLHMEMSVLHWVYETTCMNSPRTVTTYKECIFCGSLPRIFIYLWKVFLLKNYTMCGPAHNR